MNKSDIYFAILQYIPSPVRREAINVGIAIHSPEQSYARFFSTTNYRRIEAFDDEYDKTYFHIMMESFHYDIDYPVDQKNLELSLGDEQRFDYIKSPDYLRSKTEYLSNEFIFLPIKSLPVIDNNTEQTFRYLRNTYLYYDRPKSERISARKVRAILGRQLKAWGLKRDSLVASPKAEFSTKPFFDFNLSGSFVKVLSFDYSRNEPMARELKAILFDLNKILNEKEVSRIRLVVDDEAPNNELFSHFEKMVSREIDDSNIDVKVVTLSNFFNAAN